MRNGIHDKKRIVIKVGTSTLTYENGKINLHRLERLTRAISDIKNRDKDIILVSSGAVGAGFSRLGIKEHSKDVTMRQAAAAVGQCELMNLYSRFFVEYGYTVAQFLLTRDVMETITKRNNCVNTFNRLFTMDVIPIVNENDTVSVDELNYINKFGDNDTLAAMVSELIGADLLIILSDIDGLYNADPHLDSGAVIIHNVEQVTDEIREMAGGAGSSRGTGGMATKIRAAERVNANGCDMIIACGENPEILQSIMLGEDVGTLFIAGERG